TTIANTEPNKLLTRALREPKNDTILIKALKKKLNKRLIERLKEKKKKLALRFISLFRIIKITAVNAKPNKLLK
ncbi:unnamed protein product, partial [Fusarium fujikuroi]